MKRKIAYPIKSIWVMGSTSTIAKSLCILLAEKGCKTFHLIARNEYQNNLFKDLLLKKYNVVVTTELIDLSKEFDTKKFTELNIGYFDLYFIAAGDMGSNNLARDDFIEAQNIVNFNFFSLVKWITKITTKKRT